MYLLEHLFVGLLYLPFLITPFALLFWYAFVAKRINEQGEAAATQSEEKIQVSGR